MTQKLPVNKSRWRRCLQQLAFPAMTSFPKSLKYWKYRLMQHLQYPVERRSIALDFDATASTNIAFWKNFVVMAHSQNYDVYIVTARHPNSIDDIRLHFGGIVRDIIATSHKAKKPFCQDMGLRMDIFIDDSPWNVYLNIDGTVPKFESLSFMHPDFGSDIANMLFPRNHPLRIHGYGFYYTDMHWEVPQIQQSFHRTKAGAYKAMREFLWNEEVRHRKSFVEEPRYYYPGKKKGATSDKRQGHYNGPFPFSRWSIQKTVLEIKD
jgi:hypothetical protein